jgi:hypothetical protein
LIDIRHQARPQPHPARARAAWHSSASAHHATPPRPATAGPLRRHLQQLGHERIGTLTLALKIRAVTGRSSSFISSACNVSRRALSVAVIGRSCARTGHKAPLPRCARMRAVIVCRFVRPAQWRGVVGAASAESSKFMSRERFSWGTGYPKFKSRHSEQQPAVIPHGILLGRRERSTYL